MRRPVEGDRHQLHELNSHSLQNYQNKSLYLQIFNEPIDEQEEKVNHVLRWFILLIGVTLVSNILQVNYCFQLFHMGQLHVQ